MSFLFSGRAYTTTHSIVNKTGHIAKISTDRPDSATAVIQPYGNGTLKINRTESGTVHAIVTVGYSDGSIVRFKCGIPSANGQDSVQLLETGVLFNEIFRGELIAKPSPALISL